MIRLGRIHIENFRGIRNLELDFAKENFAIHGPNGSGKSGVVDAIEFALTGNVTRLTGAGTSGVTIKKHGPHVDFRDKAREAKVFLEVTIEATGNTASITRTVDKPNAPAVSPDDPAVRAVFDAVAQHSEVVLSRREIIKYILVEPGKRAEEIQRLLKLERLDNFRGALRTASNKLTQQESSAEAIHSGCRTSLKQALGIEDLAPTEVLKEVNRLRALLSAAALTALSPEVSITEGLEAAGTQGSPVSKEIALRDLKAIRNLHGPETAKGPQDTMASLQGLLGDVRGDHALLQLIVRKQFLQTGLSYVDDDSCPLCDKPWSMAALKAHIQEKLARAKAGTELEGAILQHGATLAKRAKAIGTQVEMLARTATALMKPELASGVEAWLRQVTGLEAQCKTITQMLNIEETSWGVLIRMPAEAQKVLDDLEVAVAALPDKTEKDAARDKLLQASIRLNDARTAEKKHARAKKIATKARAALEVFDATLEASLNTLYAQVEARLQVLYQLVNSDDEATFQAKLNLSGGSVGLDVDFHGRGLFPPVAYHSEGHQDGMGLCLYLALMEQMYGGSFSFAVLDDVVMSVDAMHRKEVCRLMQSQFPNTQFIITTHDQVWLNQMRHAKLVKSKAAVTFARWSVECGPMLAEMKEVWEEIETHLQNEKVSEAASALRRYLEGVAGDLGQSFGAEAMLRLDNAYELGELLPKVVGRWKSLLGKAADAAQSWKNDEGKAAVKERSEAFTKAVATCAVEQWAVNPAVHYNAWANFTRQDFQPVTMAYRDLLKCFQCDGCQSWLRLEPNKVQPTTIRCDCGQTMVNLEKAKK